MTYDGKCYDLAEMFLLDYPLGAERRDILAEKLAQEIQRTIEDFLENELRGKVK